MDKVTIQAPSFGRPIGLKITKKIFKKIFKKLSKLQIGGQSRPNFRLIHKQSVQAMQMLHKYIDAIPRWTLCGYSEKEVRREAS